LEQLETLALHSIEKAISSSKSDCFIINQNHEIVIPDSEKSLLHPNYFDVPVTKKLFDRLYSDKEQFVPNDFEADSHVFIQRLNALASFLKRIGEDPRPVKRIINNIRDIEGSVKIESLTLRVFDDLRNPLFVKALLHPAVKFILNGFCQQREMGKKELLVHVEQLQTALSA